MEETAPRSLEQVWGPARTAGQMDFGVAGLVEVDFGEEPARCGTRMAVVGVAAGVAGSHTRDGVRIAGWNRVGIRN